MNGYTTELEERMQQLLADRATEGLDMGSASELDPWLWSHPNQDVDGFERAAAAINIATLPPITDSLPSTLRDRILCDAGLFFGTMASRRFAPEACLEKPVMGLARVERRWAGRVAWYLAAACLVLAVLGWWQVFSNGKPSIAAVPRQYAEFVRQTGDLVRASWVGKEPGFTVVSGDLVWSNANQHGFMRLVGVPPNDPQVAQYQLWIVDPDRDKHPIDGGVFDVRTAGEVVIPIDAKLHADNPKVFAITLEKPGGVVVSGGPLLVVASVTG